MKITFTFFIILCLTSCQGQPDLLEGEWHVSNGFYKATYQIIKKGDFYAAVILKYDDGTTRFNHEPTNHRYLFSNLRKKKDVYVDGLSGATKSETAKVNFLINSRHSDTLWVDQYIRDRPIREVWTRIKYQRP